MKKILLFLSFLLISIGVFGAAATMTGGSNAQAVTVNGKSGFKCGTGKGGGSMNITVPSGAVSITFFISGWGSDGTVVSVTPNNKVNTTSITPSVDACFTGNGTTFTTNNSELTYTYTITLNNITSSTDIQFSTSAYGTATPRRTPNNGIEHGDGGNPNEPYQTPIGDFPVSLAIFLIVGYVIITKIRPKTRITLKFGSRHEFSQIRF